MTKELEKEEHWLQLRQYERECWEQGYSFIMGCDEVGRGCIAGPVVAGAVILPRDFNLLDLRDSKAATKRMRERWTVQIKEQAVCWAIAQVEPSKIDTLNIANASLLAMEKARQELSVQPDYILIDGCSRLPDSKHIPQKPIIKGDTKSAVIASASVIAKLSPTTPVS
jgi:ribonuclease HII